jgi:y4mF family transcriptional regulator
MVLIAMVEDPFFENLATLVRQHRKQSGLSQQELAKYAGVGKTVVYDIEHAKKSIQLNTLLKVLKVLNIHIQLSSPLMAHLKVENSA